MFRLLESEDVYITFETCPYFAVLVNKLNGEMLPILFALSMENI